jgi:hypothetical protein
VWQRGLAPILRRTGDRLWTAYRHASRNVDLRSDENAQFFSEPENCALDRDSSSGTCESPIIQFVSLGYQFAASLGGVVNAVKKLAN